MRQTILAAAVMAGFAAGLARGQAPASPPVKPVVDDYYGVKVTDPYRYFEDLNDPETAKWMKGQAEYARATLDALPGRGEIRADIEKYVNASPGTVSQAMRVAGRVFFLKLAADQTVAKLYMRQGENGPDELLVDTAKFTGPKGESPAMNYFQPSPDGKLVAYGVSVGGSEAATMRIVDVASGKDFAEEIDRAQFGGVNWRADGRSFFYTRLQKLGKDSSPLEKYKRSQVYLHVVGTEAEKDVDVFGIGVSGRVAIDPVDDEWVQTEEGSDYCLGVVEHGTGLEHTLYVAKVADVGNGDTPWVKVCDVDAQVTDSTIHGDDLYLMSHRDAPRFKIEKVSLAHPDEAHAQIVAPESGNVLRQVGAARDALYIGEIDDGVYRVVRLAYGGEAKRLELPVEGYALVCPCDTREDGALVVVAGWTRAAKVYTYDAQQDKMQPTDIQPAGPYDALDELTSVEVKAPSWDGTLVPLSIVYKKGLELNGNNPTALYAYGGYGITTDPGFSPAFLAWYRRGGILAIAHTRGGGEEGEAWHRGAYKLSKPNVWRDLIACGEFMIERKYTSPRHLGIYGGSNGGITMGRAITERPDLFAAVDIRSGLMDSVRFEHDPNGPGNVAEFGSVSSQEGFEDLYAMDAYLHVRDGVAYPAVLLTTGINDPRVQPWSPAKMAARLQAATSSGKPVLLQIDYQGGHGIGASKKQRNDTTADMFAFFLSQFAKD